MSVDARFLDPAGIHCVLPERLTRKEIFQVRADDVKSSHSKSRVTLSDLSDWKREGERSSEAHKSLK